ncbi:MAG: hypothetical protein JSS74_17000 [Actinobacteria bacterium]|nr:hypothetical protein [Actinomycetota bacterium]
MHSPRQSVVRTGIATGVLAVAVVLGGCTPGPAPTPTPTPLFTSEAEAFKAAEAVYREYTDAGNASRNGDSSAAPDKYLAGSALEDDIKARRDIKAAGLTVSGSLVVQSFSGTKYDPRGGSVAAIVCLGVGDTRVMNKDGQDVTPVGRPKVSAVAVEFARANKGAALMITRSESSSETCAASGS